MQFEKRILIPLYHRILELSKERLQVMHIIYYKYEEILKRVISEYGVECQVYEYGSVKNGFLDEKGGLDICLVPSDFEAFVPVFDVIKKEIDRKRVGKEITDNIRSSNNSLSIKIADNETNIIVHIDVQHELPIINTGLLKMYASFDQRFHIMGIYIKFWAKNNNIHGSQEGYLSSYALLILLINFLQNVVKPAVLPNIQRIPYYDEYKKQYFKEKPFSYMVYKYKKKYKTNIYYEEDIDKIERHLLTLNNGKKNTETVSNLLVKFFEYYAFYFDSSQKINIGRDLKGYISNKNDIAFSMEDPFELYNNPGKSLKINSCNYFNFVGCMKKEVNYILSGEYIKRLENLISNAGN